MSDFRTHQDEQGNISWIETRLSGQSLLVNPLLNKGTAFTYEERLRLRLLGKLPFHAETLEDQVLRSLHQYRRYQIPLNKHIFLRTLHEKNEILFYKLVTEYLEEMFPFVYTPSVSDAVVHFSQEFRQPRGLYLTLPDIDRLEAILDNRTHPDINLIVMTDGERILGIGDQGIGGMDIPIAKLVVYALCGYNPYHTLPILLDVGTDNETLLNDPLYLGWRHRRIRGTDYDAFIDKVVTTFKKRFPNILLHWEDFGRDNAARLLTQYRNDICSFNDDMQGTAVVTLAALLAAVECTEKPLEAHTILIYGAGTAGAGIAHQLKAAFCEKGLTEQQACDAIWLVDKDGLVCMGDVLTISQEPFAKSPELLAKHGLSIAKRDLQTLVDAIHPSILLGCSAQTNHFTEKLVRTVAKSHERPIIFCLSNPGERAEATPQNIIDWTEGRAIIATGSPFAPVQWQDKTIPVPQCNNAFAFPGIGLGVAAVQATKVTDGMLMAASLALADLSAEHKSVLPAIHQVRVAAYNVALAVANQARADGVATASADLSTEELLARVLWEPKYHPIFPESMLP
ncbi:MAG: NAD-dependent malic enzyme [Pseudomonadota bacterium]